MRKYLFTIILTLTCFNLGVYAQNQSITIDGIINDQNGTPIEAATVILQTTDSSAQYGTITNKNGQFVLKNIPTNTYNVTCQCMGYSKHNQTIVVDGNKTLPTITLNEEAQLLSEVKVVASLTKIKPTGEITIQMTGNPLTKGKSMLEIMKLIRGIQVFDNEILINGKENIVIYLGDRKISLQEMQSIPPEMIKEIEILPNADISYGANTNGVIKLTLRNKSGLIGSLNISPRIDKFGLNELPLTSTLLYQNGKFSLYNTLKMGMGNYKKRYQREDKLDTLDIIDTKIAIDKKNKGVLDQINLKYQFAQNHYISLYGGGLINADDDIQTNTIMDVPNLNTNFKNKTNELNAGIFYKLGLPVGQGSEFTIRAEYTNQKSGQNNRYLLEQEDTAELKQTFRYLHVEPRLDLKFKHNQRVRAAFTWNDVNDDNDMEGVDIEQLPEICANKFKISGGDYISWADYSIVLWQRLFVQAGVRYQITDLHYENHNNTDLNYNRRHTGLYPNVLAQILLNPQTNSALDISYRHDFSLPNYGYYSPLVIYQTDHLYSKGNLTLDKEKFNTVEVNYYLNQDLALTYRLRHGKDMIHIMTHQDQDDPTLFYTQPENIGKMMINYLSVDYSGFFTKWWRTNSQIYTQSRKEWTPERHIHSMMVGINTVQQFSITENIGLSLQFDGFTPYERLNYKQGASFSLSGSTYIYLLHNKLYLRLAVSNFLHSKDKLTITNENATMIRTDRSPFTRVMFSLRWNFSAGDKIKSSQAEKISSPTREKPIL